MDWTHLEKPKPINLYSPGKEPYRKNTHRKTKNEMGRCTEGRGRTRRRK